jgi:hypothetical protein
VLLVLPVFGVNSKDLHNVIIILAGVMFLPIVLMIFGGLAYNVNRWNIVDNRN